MPTVKTLASIPAKDKDEVVEDFRSESTSVQVAVSDGLFTITATFPDNLAANDTVTKWQ
ncbi:hypothetical protein [Nitrosomonas sp.]|uniref:hypothetical protein n=1 Tax=Nitrosomonas sp. TaxID=42353 RepID=UPI002841FBEE|nr:hypothetical protein [Nitrosomonas sp.]MDR4515468.1 hypothetical protein [Nitrosomonas sp.]